MSIDLVNFYGLYCSVSLATMVPPDFRAHYEPVSLDVILQPVEHDTKMFNLMANGSVMSTKLNVSGLPVLDTDYPY